MIENNIPNMIQMGQFGYNTPMNYNYQQPMAMGNMINIGSTNYNNQGYTYQPVQPQATYDDPYANVNPAVFQQYHQYYNQYNNAYPQQQYSYGYGNNYYGYDNYNQCQGPFQTAPATQYGYVDPNAITSQQTQLYNRFASANKMGQYANTNNNPYGYGQFQSYQQSQQQYMQAQQENLEMLRIKTEIACAACGKTLNEEEFDRRFNPNHQSKQIPDEELIKNREFENMKSFGELFRNPPMQDTPGMSIARHIQRISSNYHQYFDQMSMREFLDNHLWRLKREEWIRENINLNEQHDLSSTYSSQDYNDLLKMHSDTNSYINRLLDTSQYDNNLDDMEVGLREALDLERRKKAILEGRVPQFISSNETIKARNEWMNGILGQMAKKNERRSNPNV